MFDQMPHAAKQHPTQEQLTAFGLGTLDVSEAEKIAEHLNDCPSCGATIQSLPDDTFVSLVRESLSAMSAENDTSEHGSQVTVNVPPAGEGRWDDVTELPSELRDQPRYDLLELIGRGGMGEVYKAQHRVMNRIVALKVIKPELVQNDAAVERFHREVQAAAALNHPNIVTAYDAEQAGDVHYLVMEYAEGMDLSELVRRSGPLPIADACELVRQAALGLEHAHQNGLVHRDIKPSNLMLTTDGTVKILDLGLALLETQGEDMSELTAAGQTMGTLDFMAPEQGGNSHEVDIRADIYSLGATLYKLLTGEVIYAGEHCSGSLDKLRALAFQPAPPIQSRRADVPDELAAVIHKMIAKDRDERYATPGEVAEALAPLTAQANVAGLLAAMDDDATLWTEPVVSKISPSAASPQAHTKPQIRWFHNKLVWLATGGGALLILLAALVLLIPTKDGTIRVEITDPQIEVAIKGTDIVLQQADQGKDVKLSPGDHTLVVKRDDFRFETDKLILKRGDEVTVRVELLPGEVQVRQGGKLIGQQKLPALADDGHRPTTVPTTTLPNGWVIGEPVNLGPAVNSSAADHSPCLSADGLTLFFASNRPREGFSDLWTSTRPAVGQPWGEPVDLGPAVNSAEDDLQPYLSADSLTLLFTSDRRGGEGGEDLWACSRADVDESWGKAVNLGPAVNSPHSEGTPFLSADGRLLLFKSDRPGGQGDADLWMARRDHPGEEFGEPVNLGPTVNSPKKDQHPCLSHDGMTLLFSSERVGSKGWHDFWMATRVNSDEPFGKPVNLGPTINTAGNEMGPFLTGDEQTLYFAAQPHPDEKGSRPGAHQGGLDIYQVPIRAPRRPANPLPNGWMIGEPINLGPAVNSASPEFSPWLSADGLTLFFASNRPRGKGYSNLWACKRSGVNQPWGEPFDLGSAVNSAVDDYHPCLSADSLTLLLASNRLGGEGDFDLWSCSRLDVDQPWGKPVNLGSVINSPHGESAPFLSSDGRVLLFTSNRPGGQGELDLWMARRDHPGEEFGEPVNLGPTVNSPDRDHFPCLSRDGLTLLLSSNRPGCKGWEDLWMSTRANTEEPFGKPVNLGPTINTAGNEMGPFLTGDEQTLYFAARPHPDEKGSRPGAQGGLDIYQVPIRAPRYSDSQKTNNRGTIDMRELPQEPDK